MADDAQITEEYIVLNEKGTCPFFYASRYGTKVKSFNDLCVLLGEINGR